MFDKFEYKVGHTEYVPYEKTVTINRAPTDESIKLFGEMKDKAYKSLLETISINSNAFSGSAQIYKDYQSDSVVTEWRFLLNGKEFTGFSKTVAWSCKDRDDLIHKIFESVSCEITKQLLQSVDRADMLLVEKRL